MVSRDGISFARWSVRLEDVCVGPCGGEVTERVTVYVFRPFSSKFYSTVLAACVLTKIDAVHNTLALVCRVPSCGADDAPDTHVTTCIDAHGRRARVDNTN